MKGLRHPPLGLRPPDAGRSGASNGPGALLQWPLGLALGSAACWAASPGAPAPAPVDPSATALGRAPSRPPSPAAPVSGAAGRVALAPGADARAQALPGTSPEASPSLPHWQGLMPGRRRDFPGGVYDPSVVQRVYRDEVYAWEHDRTTGSLEHLAAHDGWAAHAVPPITLAYSETGLPVGGRAVHYAVVDGHHRLNADRGNQGVPAMVTHRWSPDEHGSLVGYGRWPRTDSQPSLPTDWNPRGEPLQVHAPESIGSRSIWGHAEIRLCLPSTCIDQSLADMAPRLNAFKPPAEFMQAGRGDRVHVRALLIDVYAQDCSSKQGTLQFDLGIQGVDPASRDWQNILRDGVPLRQHFGVAGAPVHPLLEIRIQQNPHGYVDEGL